MAFKEMKRKGPDIPTDIMKHMRTKFGHMGERKTESREKLIARAIVAVAETEGIKTDDCISYLKRLI